MTSVTAATSDRRAVLERLAAAEGYAVFDRRGKRVGAFIELADTSGTQIAIREDGVLVWRRRFVPLSIVGDVIPESGAVVLNVGKRALRESTHKLDTRADRAESDEQETPSENRRNALIAHYASAKKSDVGRPAELEEGTTSNADSTDGRELDRHLLFVSTPSGYHLLERQGQAPAAWDYVSVAEHQGLFRVVKLAASPLPNDRSICAYLEQAE